MKEKLWSLVGGRDSSIHSKFLRITLLAVCIHMIFHVVIGLIAQQIGDLRITVAGSLLFSSVYIFLYFTNREKIVKLFLFVISIVLLCISWFKNAGVLGATPVFFILATFGFVAFLPGRYHIWIVVGMMSLFWGLYFIEGMHPEWVSPYITQKSNIKDIQYSTFFICIAICIVFSFMLKRLEEQNRSLAEKVTEQEALSAKLEEQYHAQIELNQALDSFVYRSSHDLRAPLNSALGLIEITKDAQSKEEMDYYLDLQKKNLKRLDVFITDILYYSQNRHKALTIETISVVSLIDEALNQIQHLSSYTQIKLVKELKKEDTIIGDSLRLRIIFNNIISNAYKYFDPEKPNPFFKIAFNKTEQEVHIIFEDNGLGIDEPFIPRIFEMFYRATHKAEGTGIGLFIVKESVEKMGGRIECSSILGEGSRFDVILPM